MLSFVLTACTPEPLPGHGIVVADFGPAGVLGRRLAVEVARPGPAWAECTSPDDPEEHHLFESRHPVSHHEIAAVGLLAETAYDCSVHAAGFAEPVSFVTGSLPDLDPWIVSGETTGYTLFNTQDLCNPDEDPSYVLVVDPQGRVRWILDVGTDLVCDLDAQYFPGDPPRIHVGGGWASFANGQDNRGVFIDVDLAGDVLLDRTVPDFGKGFNHHSERLPDGTYLSLTAPEEAVGDLEYVGVGVEQWAPSGLVWTWQSQGLVEGGFEAVAGANSPFTANAVSLVEDSWGPAAWVSIYSRMEMWRIDKVTGERTHVFEHGGEFALFDPAGNPLPPSEFTFSQHHPQWIDGPTGPDQRVLLYDNGNNRPGGSYSRVAEYDLDLDARTATLLWTWTEPDWYDPTLGDADRLPDGHVLVAQGFNVKKTPESADRSEIVELVPPDDVVWRLTMTRPETPLYRADRIDACDIFGNLTFCPRLADRLDALSGR